MAETINFVWDLGSMTFELEWEIPGYEPRDQLVDLYLNRTEHDVLHFEDYAHYLRNDPRPQLARELARTLAAVASSHRIDIHSLSGLNFLLHFIHRLDYIRDPDLPHDYPRYPGETIVVYGGDCEDSAILFCALASYWGHRTCLHDLIGRHHIAAGVAHPDAFGVSYMHDGVRYYIAETAISGNGYVDVGEPFSFSKGARARMLVMEAEMTGIHPLDLDVEPVPHISMKSIVRSSKLTLYGSIATIVIDDASVIGRKMFIRERGAETISRKHARVFQDGDRWFIMALADRNTTLVNSREVGEFRRVELASGSRLRLGGVTLRVEVT